MEWEVWVVEVRSGIWSSLYTHLFISSLNLTPYFTSFPFLKCKQITYTKGSSEIPQGLCPQGSY